MGNFKIQIDAVGAHGCDRDAKQGDKIHYRIDHTYPDGDCPDCNLKAFVERFARSSNVLGAKLTHWPDTTPIVDDLKTGVREHGDFTERWQGEDMLKHLNYNLLPDGPCREIARPFVHLAYMLVRTVPRSAERTVALRKLLDGMDAAIRAAKS